VGPYSLVAAVPVAAPGAAAGEPFADTAPRQYQFSADSPFTPAWAGAYTRSLFCST
jgi:coiled-coil and C2 domain-containing protein 2A